MKYGDVARILLHHPEEGVVQLDIDDSGPGIDSDKMEVVFEPFRRLTFDFS
jgi:signal transduction histidine kinase